MFHPHVPGPTWDHSLSALGLLEGGDQGALQPQGATSTLSFIAGWGCRVPAVTAAGVTRGPFWRGREKRAVSGLTPGWGMERRESRAIRWTQ